MSLNDQYKRLLSTQRARNSTYSERDLITEAESDRARLVFCPAFRRLQQKAQVFSMEPNAAVRSRLTHSLEVSQVGRYIAELIAKQLEKKCSVDEHYCRAVVKFVENACLMHDIGTPLLVILERRLLQNGSPIMAFECLKKPAMFQTLQKSKKCCLIFVILMEIHKV